MEPFIGQIQPFGFNFAPQGWALCNGQLLSIAQNSALFSLLGTTYGGDGQTTFALPDLRGRIPLHFGSGPGLPTYQMGQRAGSYQITLNTSNLPTHNHGLVVSSGNASQTAATAGASIATPGTLSGRTFTATNGFNTSTPDTVLNAASIANNGGNQAFNSMNPYIVINWCIAIFGIFPSRG
ncbi:MAG: tail fiber protein [Flavobacteriaceae bacterium]